MTMPHRPTQTYIRGNSPSRAANTYLLGNSPSRGYIISPSRARNYATSNLQQVQMVPAP